MLGLVFAISDRFNLSGPFLGPDAEVLVDVTSPISTVVIVGATPPLIQIPVPLTCALNGTVWHSQFFGFDQSATWLASSLVSFTVGQRPRE